jgi:hypothetical protein
MQMMGTRCRRLASSFALAALVLALPACGGGGSGNGGGVPGVTASFVTGDAAAAANLVRLVGGAVSGSNITLNVAIGGATTSSDYYAFAFDVVIGDTTVAQFVPGSATAGGFLTGGVNVNASQVGSRVVVGISKQGAVAGNGTAAAEATVISLTFQLLKVGSTGLTFGGSPSGNPGGANCSSNGPEAIDSTGTDCIPSTNFGAGGTISGA